MLKIFVFVAFAWVGMLLVTYRAPHLKYANLSSSRPTPNVRVSNAYERSTGRKIGNGHYPHRYIVDVAHVTRLECNEEVTWELLDKTFEGKSIEVKFPEIGDHRVVARLRTTGFVAFDDVLTVRSVRRELRELSDIEREAYFSALYTLYNVPDEQGRRMFGEEYVSADWLVREHLYGAAQKDCDHWHDDAGIMNHHVGITWQLEKSMRLVNPDVAAHYWDYVLDASEYSENWQQSPIFHDDWFGPASAQNASHILSTGRWAYTRVMSVRGGGGDGATTTFSNLTNPYGLLRSPWNTNKQPFVHRFDRVLGQLGANFVMPSCSKFTHYLTEGSTVRLADLLEALNGELHGPVHILIGGHWGLDPYWDEFSQTQGQRLSMSQMLLMSKFMWRQGYVRCPETCSWDTPQSDCVCSCPPLGGDNMTAHEILNVTGVLSRNMPFGRSWSSATYRQLLDALCRVGFPGEMFTSAAPQDPTFWPLHGNAERYLQYVRLAARRGDFDLDETWDYSHQTMIASDTGVVCDWEGVSGLERPTCFRGTCPGHRAEDILPFQDYPYTNVEFYANITSPWSPHLTYVYDSLTYWPGCPENKL